VTVRSTGNGARDCTDDDSPNDMRHHSCPTALCFRRGDFQAAIRLIAEGTIVHKCPMGKSSQLATPLSASELYDRVHALEAAARARSDCSACRLRD
jgi:hypothetical protein